MKIVDLTQPLTAEMPVFPGTPPPKFNVKHTVESDGFREMEITMYSHTGTHLDTPAHVFLRGKKLEDYGADQFWGPGLVLDVSQRKQGKITLEVLQKALEKSLYRDREGKKTITGEEVLSSGGIPIDYLFFYTGWDQYWGDPSYVKGGPSLCEQAARKLTALELKGVGIDAPSVDPLEGDRLLAHRILLEKEILIVENLRNLKELLEQDFEFYGFPLKIQGGEGSPIRGIGKIL